MRTTAAVLLVILSACGPGAVGIVGGQGDHTGGSTGGGSDDTAADDPCTELGHPDLRVNELVSSNVRGAEDEDGDTSDWLELVNLDEEDVDLGGWGLSDDPDEPGKWTLPAVELDAGEVLLVWASGKDRTDPDGLHTSFSLSAEGEPVVLTAPDGCVVDLLEPGRLYRDIAAGRPQGDPDAVEFFLEPTPGEPNTTESRPGFAEPPLLTPEAGFYDEGEPITVSATGGEDDLRITLDASEPVEDGEQTEPYEGALSLPDAEGFTIVRARAFADGLWPSRITTASYSTRPEILDDDLKVASLVVAPFDLYDEETGIYAFGPDDYSPDYPYFGANFWEEWERDLSVEVWEPDGSLVLAQPAGVRIHGGYTRAFDQKNFRVIARTGYGEDSLDYAFFPKEELDSFKIVVLEGVGDWCPTHTENVFVQEFFYDLDDKRIPTIDAQAWEPTALYLNGEFWGLYSFREKLDEHFIAAHHGADPDNLDRIECTADGTDDWWRVSQGDWEAFDELEEFVATHDLADEDAWAEFETMVDVDNLATAIIAEGYGANSDWWDNNLKLWRERTDDARWRWMVFDIGHGWSSPTADHLGTSVDFNGKGMPIAPALRNEGFRVLLANQGSDFLNTNLKTSVALARLDEMHGRIQPLIAEQYALWCGYGEPYWESRVAGARAFVASRESVLRGQLQTHLALEGSTQLSLEASPAGSGSFRLTVVEVEPPFTGQFWTGIPVTITALPADGLSFAGWSDSALGTEETVEIVLDGPLTLTASFD